MNTRLIFFNQRLWDLSGHRLAQALGFLAATRRRGIPALLFVSESATPELRGALPCRPVLHDPVFQLGRSFDQRTADLVAMLHRHVDPELWPGDRLLHPVATQCEARALAIWLAELPHAKRPWTVVLFVSDRWNRYGIAERERQLREFQVLAADLAGLAPDVQKKILFATYTEGLREELTTLLGMELLQMPFTVNLDLMSPGPHRPAGSRPVACCAGGARPEKGFQKIPAIVAECRRRSIEVDFLLQLLNEQLPQDAFEELCRLSQEPGIRAIHGGLNRAPYRAMLAEADFLLFPYDRIPYRQRNSDVLIEACLMGLPVVVPSETWLSSQVDSGAAAGIVFDSEDAGSIAAAIGRCVAELPALSRQARSKASYWRENQGIEPFLDRFELEIRRRSPVQP